MDLALTEFRSVLGCGAVVEAEHDIVPYRRDEACSFSGSGLIVLRPGSAQDVSEILKICDKHEVQVVTRGGGTGLAGGAVPVGNGPQVVLSTERLNQIRLVDPTANILIAETGVPLDAAKAAAQKVGRDITISHGASGSSTVGGTAATNAGGINVLRYGMARDQIVGVEAVMADGRFLSSPAELEKSNAGYDLGRMLIGSEGTLGVITAVTLRLRSIASFKATGLLACDDIDMAMEVLRLMRDHLSGDLSAFELMSQSAMQVSLAHSGSHLSGMKLDSPWYVLIESEASGAGADLEAALTNAFEAAFTDGLASDGVVAQSKTQALSLWAVRHGIAEAMSENPRPFMRTDTAVPVRYIPNFLTKVEQVFEKLRPDCTMVAFGHAGDGNIHINLMPGPQTDDEHFLAQIAELSKVVETAALKFEGTVSAEHGIGQTKGRALTRMYVAQDIQLMAGVKAVFDPKNILNPGKILLVPE